jgi:P-type Mg2+ transporter
MDETDIGNTVPMNGHSFYNRLNFRHAASKRHPEARDTDIKLSREILGLSQAEKDAIWTLLDASPDGLTPSEAKARLASGGPNLIAKEGRPSLLQELWGRAKNPLNALLLSLATVSYCLGDIRAAVVIAIMVVLAITTAFIQEHRSNDAAAKLRAMVTTTASVKRRGAAVPAGDDQAHGFSEIAMEQLVPGDVVWLSAGDMIPADLRLLSAKDLFINQAALTGEAMPSEKSAARHTGRSRIPSICRTFASWAAASSADSPPA